MELEIENELIPILGVAFTSLYDLRVIIFEITD